MQQPVDYNARTFRPVTTSDNGEVDSSVIFRYEQVGNVLTCSYSGGRIVAGHLIGTVDDRGNIDMRYHQVNDRGELQTGICRSRPEVLLDGRIRLHEQWQWTSGDGSSGESVLEEVGGDVD